MDVQHALLTRRSIRRYTEQTVDDAAIDTILRAAMYSPSAVDQRPWEFVVIKKRSALDALADSMSHCDMLREASVGILVCADLSREKLPGFWTQDCSACTQNILLSAHAQSLGAVWIGLHPVEERENAVRRAVGLPEQIIPFALVAVGHPAEAPETEDRFESSRIHQELW